MARDATVRDTTARGELSYPVSERVAAGFDRLAPWYDGLVWLLLGQGIPDSQVRYLELLRDCRRALVIGGGTGKFLAALVASPFRGRVTVVDVSVGMLERSRRRVARFAPSVRDRIEFRRGDVSALHPGEHFDLICTHCFLDLFEEAELTRTVERLQRHLEPGGLWACSDFTPPDGGAVRRGLQNALLATLYRFFAVVCGLRTRRLAPIRRSLVELGLDELAFETSSAGLLWSGIYRRERRTPTAARGSFPRALPRTATSSARYRRAPRRA